MTHVYLFSYLILSKLAHRCIEEALKYFLWANNSNGKVFHRVHWDLYYIPCKYGGLGMLTLTLHSKSTH